MTPVRWFLASVVLAAIAAATLWESAERTSPGPLHPSHANVPRIREGSCAVCHGDGSTGAMTAACRSCHADLAARIDARRGLHGALGAVALDCAPCHREHHGAELPLSGAHAFARAGVTAPERYDHAHVPGALSGRHRELACDACHALADREALAPGERRFLGLVQDCTGCHDDPHQGRFGARCADCHGQDAAFAQSARVRHDAFALDGAHAALACARCHEPAGPTAVHALIETPPRQARACADCHASPHGEHGHAVAIARADDCARCHGRERFAGVAFGAAEHAAIGVALLGAHARADCRVCHDRGREPPALSDCTACHASPHREAFARQADDGCASCHAPSDPAFAAAVTRLAPERHAPTDFPLAPPHLGLDCAACHGPVERPFAERHPGRAAHDCGACHRDPHRGQFDRGPTGGACSECHARERFAPANFDVDAHDATAFALRGAHRAVACTACHARPVDGAARRYAGTPRACAACHEDPHAGRFDRDGVPRNLDDRTGCARCHDESSFRALRPSGFDHAWTGYALRGAHASASCAACHTAARRPVERACASCHADPHAGQFAAFDQDGRPVAAADCARCHRESDSFLDLAFDHAEDSRFALDATHAKLACSACHPATRTASGRLVTRYRPLGIRCADCHGPRGRR